MQALLCCLIAAAMGFALATAAQTADAQRLQRSTARLEPLAEAALRVLRPLLLITQDGDVGGQLRGINLFCNQRITSITDEQVWGLVDCRASLLEALNKGQGDCEDYAIGKYSSLLAAGVAVTRLRRVYVRAQLDGRLQAHMVQAYYTDGQSEPLIPDNLVDRIVPASQRTDLTPVFSFNSDGLWQGVGMAGAGDPVTRLSRWREVTAKAHAECFL